MKFISAIFLIYRSQLEIYQRFSKYIDLPTRIDNDSHLMRWIWKYFTTDNRRSRRPVECVISTTPGVNRFLSLKSAQRKYDAYNAALFHCFSNLIYLFITFHCAWSHNKILISITINFNKFYFSIPRY